MLEYLNSDTLFNTIAMLRPERAGVFLVVEGSDDLYTLGRHVSESATVLSGLGGKRDMLEASIKTEDSDIDRVYFLVDSDYDRYIPTETRYGDQVVSSDGHDLVMDLVLVDRSVIYRVLDSHARARVTQQGSRPDTPSLVEESLNLALPVGILRLLSAQKGWNLNLRDFPFGKLSSLTPTISEFVDIALSKSPPITGGSDSISVLASSALDQYRAQALAIVGDHDFFAAAARVMKDAGWSNVKGSTLASSFLAAATCRSISHTRWFRELDERSESACGTSCFMCPCDSIA